VPSASTGLGTPQLTIVTEMAGTRTWFTWLGTAVDQLTSVDLTPLATLGWRVCTATASSTPRPGTVGDRCHSGRPRFRVIT